MTLAPTLPRARAAMRIETRQRDAWLEARWIEAGAHPLLARLHASRGAQTAIARSPTGLLHPTGMLGIELAAQRIVRAIEGRERVVIVADYDCDGATACAVGLLGLRAMGADVDYVVPNRFKTGYGLSPAIVDIAAAKGRPSLIVTVDNGIASVEGVDAARALGIDVVITDHHLPGSRLPAACAIVNPNQPGCRFPSKSIAGVGVMFYVLTAVRARLRASGRFDAQSQPRLHELLDLVALGTIADVVKLDDNNRLLVQLGLDRIRAGRARPGILALARVAGRDPRALHAADLGFALGPRLNAAGRLADMSTGIECLIATDAARAFDLALTLDRMNTERRALQADMHAVAIQALDDSNLIEATLSSAGSDRAIVLRDDRFHAGVTGLVASKLKDTHYKPTLVFAPVDGGRLTASGRSIPGFHLRDALDLVSKRAPDVIERFGGHAMAAGLTLHEASFEQFAAHFHAVANESLGEARADQVIRVDGSLEAAYFSPSIVRMIEAEVWGQGYEPPLFNDRWRVVSQRVLKDKHLKATVERNGQRLEAIAFGRVEALPDNADLVFRLGVNEYNGSTTVQMIIEHVA